MSFALHYRPGTNYGDRFPSWRFGFRQTAEAAEALRLRCPSADDLEVVEVTP